MGDRGMEKREVVVGLDIGTTSVKAVLFDIHGKLIYETEEMNTTFHPRAGWAEQDPDQILENTTKVIKQTVNQVNQNTMTLLGIGLSSAMHSLICLDDHMKPLSNNIIWSDGRSSNFAEELLLGNGKEIYKRTGTPIHPMSPFLKLVWMKETEFAPYHKASYFMSMKEYLVYKWFGKRWVDYSVAAASGLYNVSTHDWDEEAITLVGLSKDQLSEIVEPQKRLPSLQPKVASELGISTELPFVIGAADGQFANLGDGAISPGEVAISVGTSGAIRQFTEGAPIDPNMETFTYAFTKNTSIVGGPTNNGGIVLQWLKDTLEFKGSHEEFLRGAEKVKPGAEGILFLPYVNGERAPLWNQKAKGNLYGLTIEHRKDHIVRAVLEGIAFNLYHISQSLERMAGQPKRITVNGGLSQSELWVQILADIFGKSIHLSESHHSVAWGAAWTALVGIGRKDSYEEIKENISVRKVIQPNLEHHELYLEIFKKYEKLSKETTQFFD